MHNVRSGAVNMASNVNESSNKCASKTKTNKNSTKTNRGIVWPDEATEVLIGIWGEETVQLALEHAKCAKETREVYRRVSVSSLFILLQVTVDQIIQLYISYVVSDNALIIKHFILMVFKLIRSQVQMENKGFTFNVNDIINKMKKLRQKYKSEKDKAKKSGCGGGNHGNF